MQGGTVVELACRCCWDWFMQFYGVEKKSLKCGGAGTNGHWIGKADPEMRWWGANGFRIGKVISDFVVPCPERSQTGKLNLILFKWMMNSWNGLQKFKLGSNFYSFIAGTRSPQQADWLPFMRILTWNSLQTGKLNLILEVDGHTKWLQKFKLPPIFVIPRLPRPKRPYNRQLCSASY